MMIHVSQLTQEQLPYALMLAMKRKTVPEINWELAGKIIEKEKRISLVARYEKYSALYIGLKSDGKQVEIEAKNPLEAIIRCYIAKELGYEINIE